MRPFDLGDVPRNAKGANGLSLFIAQWHFGRQYPIRTIICLFHIQERVSGAQNRLLLLELALRHLGREEIKIALADGLIWIETFVLSICPVGFDDTSLPVLKIDTVRDVCHKGIEHIVLPDDFRRAFLYPPDEDGALQRAADLRAQGFVNARFRRSNFKHDIAQLVLSKIQRLDHQTVLLVLGQQAFGYQLAGRKTLPAGFDLDAPVFVIGQEQSRPPGGLLRVFVHGQVATRNVQAR